MKGSSQQYLTITTMIKLHLIEQFFLLEKPWDCCMMYILSVNLAYPFLCPFGSCADTCPPVTATSVSHMAGLTMAVTFFKACLTARISAYASFCLFLLRQLKEAS